MSDDSSSGSDDQSSSLNATDDWCVQLGVPRDSFNRSDGDSAGNGDNSPQQAGVGPGNWGRGPGQDYRGPGGAKDPGPDNPVRVPADGDNAPDTMPRNRVDVDPDADPGAPTDPSPTLKSPEFDPTPQGPPQSTPPPSPPPPRGPGTPPGDDIPPTLRSPGNPAPTGPDVAAPGAAGVVITGDVVLTGSVVLVGVVEIAGAIYKIVMGWQIADLAQSYTPSVNAAQAGFKAAMTGGAAPGDQFGKLGYDQGSKNFQALFAKTKQDNPQATDDAIKQAIAAKADDALKQVAGGIDEAVRTGMWDGYLAAHSTALSGDDARWAYVACFGDEPDSKNPDAHWKKYMNAHPYLSWTSPK